MCWLLLVGAGGGIFAAATEGVSAPATLRLLGSGQQCRIVTPERVAVRSAAEWKALRQRAFGPEAPDPAARVSWDREMVLAVFLGQKNTGGWRVALRDVRPEGGRLVVRWEARGPAKDDVTLQALTSPWTVAAVPRDERPVLWRAVPGSAGSGAGRR